jgi:hypothetical protein
MPQVADEISHQMQLIIVSCFAYHAVVVFPKVLVDGFNATTADFLIATCDLWNFFVLKTPSKITREMLWLMLGFGCLLTDIFIQPGAQVAANLTLKKLL